MGIDEKVNRLLAWHGIRSRAALARQIGVSEVTLFMTFSGRSWPRVDTALKIARGLGVTVEWLFDDAADWPPPGIDT